MARGSKKKYTSKQKRKAEHIEKGYEKRGTSKKEAAALEKLASAEARAKP